MTIKLERIELNGSPRQMGETHGEHLREKIVDFVEMRFFHLNQYLKDRGVDFQRRTLERIGRESMEIHALWDRAGIEEHRGIARAANLSDLKLYLATNMTDMRDAFLLSAESGPKLSKADGDGEGCTSVMIPGNREAEQHPIVGQTWDLNPPDVEFVYAFDRKNEKGLSSFTVTCSGCLSLMGMNSHGLTVGTTNIKTYGSKSGVGYLGLLHAALHKKDVGEALALLKAAPLAGAHTYWLADADEQTEIEASPNGVFERSTKEGPVFRTNHCLFDTHKDIEGELTSESSQKRFQRVKENSTSIKVPADLKALFANREDGIHSINRYPEDEQGTATNAVIVASPATKELWACRGPVDRSEWVHVELG